MSALARDRTQNLPNQSPALPTGPPKYIAATVEFIDLMSIRFILSPAPTHSPPSSQLSQFSSLLPVISILLKATHATSYRKKPISECTKIHSKILQPFASVKFSYTSCCKREIAKKTEKIGLNLKTKKCNFWKYETISPINLTK